MNIFVHKVFVLYIQKFVPSCQLLMHLKSMYVPPFIGIFCEVPKDDKSNPIPSFRYSPSRSLALIICPGLCKIFLNLSLAYFGLCKVVIITYKILFILTYQSVIYFYGFVSHRFIYKCITIWSVKNIKWKCIANIMYKIVIKLIGSISRRRRERQSRVHPAPLQPRPRSRDYIAQISISYTYFRERLVDILQG